MKSGRVRAELVRDIASKVTGAHFEIIPQSASNPLPIKDIDWFVRCRNAEDIARTPYLNTIWRSVDGPIWLESLALGDTFNWIGAAYGEEPAEESLDFGYSNFGDEEVWADFASKYPVVNRRIRACELVVQQVSKRSGVHLELRASGSKGIIVFTVAARISIQDPQSIERRIGAAARALKDAYEHAMES